MISFVSPKCMWINRTTKPYFERGAVSTGGTIEICEAMKKTCSAEKRLTKSYWTKRYHRIVAYPDTSLVPDVNLITFEFSISVLWRLQH